jgi:hypothetical protein
LSNLAITDEVKEDKEYNLNDYFYRSDQFAKDHKGMHLLFNGCSQTFGDGNVLEDTWSKIVYNYINDKIGCSGYFNIAFGGNNNFSIIKNTINYINEYGKPDIIILNLTECWRGYGVSNKKNFSEEEIFNYIQLEETAKNKIIMESMTMYCFDIIKLFAEYCKTNNIKLIMFSWAYYEPLEPFSLRDELVMFGNSLLTNIQEYILITNKEVENYLLLNSVKNKNNNLFLKAKNKTHSGQGENLYWANKVLERIFDDYSWN